MFTVADCIFLALFLSFPEWDVEALCSKLSTYVAHHPRWFSFWLALEDATKMKASNAKILASDPEHCSRIFLITEHRQRLTKQPSLGFSDGCVVGR
jgi:hypothetical protein